jgi:hypothetical protein
VVFLDSWETFFAARVGASAALAGLIFFVGVSINISKILSFPRLPERALQSLVALMVALTISSLMLVLDKVRFTWARGTDRRYRRMAAEHQERLDQLKGPQLECSRQAAQTKINLHISMMQAAAHLPYIVAGTLVIPFGDVGIYFVVPAMIFSFFKVTSDS